MSDDDYDLRSVVEQVIGRASSDPDFKDRLLADPGGALRDMGAFPSEPGAGELQVSALMRNDCQKTCLKTCIVTEPTTP